MGRPTSNYSLEDNLLPHLKCVFHNARGWYTHTEYIVNCWNVVRVTEGVKLIKVAIVKIAFGKQ